MTTIPDASACLYLYLDPAPPSCWTTSATAGDAIGTPDTASSARPYRERWIPRLARRDPVPPGARATANE